MWSGRQDIASLLRSLEKKIALLLSFLRRASPHLRPAQLSAERRRTKPIS